MLYVIIALLAVAVVVLAAKILIDNRKIKRLSENIDKILHSRTYDNVGNFSRYTEGSIAVLESEIGKLINTLREQADILQEDKVHLSDYIADISHQLKTPLTSMNIVASMLMDSDLTDEERFKYIDDINRTLAKIDWLVQSLLKLARLDADTVKFENRHVDFEELMEKVHENIDIPMDIKGIQLVTHIQENSGFTGDINWVCESVVNVVKNCMEHTPEGRKIFVKAGENSLFSSIIIEDEGCGIAAEDIAHLFERFYRGKNSGSTSVGIGLNLARNIIVKQNGTIKAGNRKEGGARFEIRFNKQIV